MVRDPPKPLPVQAERSSTHGISNRLTSAPVLYLYTGTGQLFLPQVLQACPLIILYTVFFSEETQKCGGGDGICMHWASGYRHSLTPLVWLTTSNSLAFPPMGSGSLWLGNPS